MKNTQLLLPFNATVTLNTTGCAAKDSQESHVRSTYGVLDLSEFDKGVIYQVHSITMHSFDDGETMPVYLIEDKEGTVSSKFTGYFKVINKKEV